MATLQVGSNRYRVLWSIGDDWRGKRPVQLATDTGLTRAQVRAALPSLRQRALVCRAPGPGPSAGAWCLTEEGRLALGAE